MVTVDEIYAIEIKLTNPLPVDIQIDKINLLLDTCQVEQTNEFNEENQEIRIVNFVPFRVAANAVNTGFTINFTFNQIGNFKGNLLNLIKLC
jgi:hypothetical protein